MTKELFVTNLKATLQNLEEQKNKLLNKTVPGAVKYIDQASDIISGYISDFDGLPRICVIGSTGVGKSSLINHILDIPVAKTNAVFSETVTTSSYFYPKNDPVVEIIDTRGLNEILEAENTEKQLIQDLTDKRPHLIIYLTSAHNKAGVDREVEFIKYLLATCKINFGREVGCVVFANKADALSPSGFDKLPSSPWQLKNKEDSEVVALKRQNLIDKVEWLDSIIQKIKIEPKPVILPTAIKWTPEKVFWNREEAMKVIFQASTPSLLVAFGNCEVAQDNITERLEAITQEIAVRFAIISATVCWNPFPVSDAVILCPLQTAMIELIKTIGGKGSLGTWEIFKFVGLGSQASKYVANQLLKFLPGLGNVVNSTIAATTTYGIARIAIAHYVHGWGKEKLETLKDFAQFKNDVEEILKKANKNK